MQLNGTGGTVIMAASEPPEPPPRNPDKINASLKHTPNSKKSKSFDTDDRLVNLNNNNNNNNNNSNNDNNNSTTVNNNNINNNNSISSNNEKLNSKQLMSKLPLGNSKLKTMGTKQYESSTGSSNTATKASPSSTTPAVYTNDKSELISPSSVTPNEMLSSTTSDSTTVVKSKSSNSISDELDDKSSSNSASREGKAKGKEIENSNADSKGKNIVNVTNKSNDCNLKDIGNSGGFNDNIDDFNQNTSTGDKANVLIEHNTVADRKHNPKLETDKNEQIQNQKLISENIRLKNEVARLKKMLENVSDGAVGGIDSSVADSSDREEYIPRLEIELRAAHEQITILKTERRKFKEEKTDLLAHVKQLCASLQDKEQELRDFIRNFELRIRETETTNAKISNERERERLTLLKHAREEGERSIALATQLNSRDVQLERTQEQLLEARRQLSSCMSDQESLLSYAPVTPPSGINSHLIGAMCSGYMGNNTNIGLNANDRGSCSADSGVRGSSDRESAVGDLNLSDGPCDNGSCDNGPCITIDSDSISLVSSQYINQYGTPKERSPTLSPLTSCVFTRHADSTGILSRSVEHLGSPIDSESGVVQLHLLCQQHSINRRTPPEKSNTSTLGSRSTGGGHRGSTSAWGSISRVFARNRHRNKNHTTHIENMDVAGSHYQNHWSHLTEESYAEKLRILREAAAIPMERWRAPQLLAWLELALGMPQYASKCSENVKSGKVLFELNDNELESGLGLTHPMHRKKLRLAIEEHRRPELIRYPSICQLGHTWVASEWLPDIGLSQYSESFTQCIVDARMLDTLSKKELEKFLGVTRKFHQASVVHGIHVLRILKYDRHALNMRRMQSENINTDPIVWTNHRLIRWIRSIDLSEYADNLKDSGVHGGLCVLEPSFSADTLASVLGIPSSKNIIRRHLSTEFDALIVPARAQLGQGIRTGGSVVPITGPGGLHAYPTTSVERRSAGGSLRYKPFSGWRGSQTSLSNVFRLNTTSSSKTHRSNDNGKSIGATSPTLSYSSQSSESGIYATVGSIPPPLPVNAPPAILPHQQAIMENSGGLQVVSSHRASAPPMDTNSTLPRYAEHRRVKSINDIEVLSVAPV